MNPESYKYIDLHIHTVYSDGLYSPAKVVGIADELNLRAIAITDHDEVAGIDEALHVAGELDIEVIPGIEMSTIFDDFEVHILGYFIDHQHPSIREYVSRCNEWRTKRAQKIVRLLNQQGVHLSYDLVRFKAGNGAVGRPHIADVLVEEGFVFSYSEAFEKFLGENKPAFVPKMKIEPVSAIQLIHQAGGLAFIAHPGVGLTDAIIHQVVRYGVDGIEILHPSHSADDVRRLGEIAGRFGLLECGGSDCHGARQGEVMIGTLDVPVSWLNAIKSKLARVRTSSFTVPPN